MLEDEGCGARVAADAEDDEGAYVLRRGQPEPEQTRPMHARMGAGMHARIDAEMHEARHAGQAAMAPRLVHAADPREGAAHGAAYQSVSGHVLHARAARSRPHAWEAMAVRACRDPFATMIAHNHRAAAIKHVAHQSAGSRQSGWLRAAPHAPHEVQAYWKYLPPSRRPARPREAARERPASLRVVDDPLGLAQHGTVAISKLAVAHMHPMIEPMARLVALRDW